MAGAERRYAGVADLVHKDLVTSDEKLQALQRDVGFPSYSTFLRARCDAQFMMSKKREAFSLPLSYGPKHKNLFSLQNKTERLEYNKLLKQHHFEAGHLRPLSNESKNFAGLFCH